MKLDKNTKEIIDKYFAEISAEELYSILTNQYGFEKDETVVVSDGLYSHVTPTSLDLDCLPIAYAPTCHFIKNFAYVEVKSVASNTSLKDSIIESNSISTNSFAA